jgi:hypothetical protein
VRGSGHYGHAALAELAVAAERLGVRARWGAEDRYEPSRLRPLMRPLQDQRGADGTCTWRVLRLAGSGGHSLCGAGKAKDLEFATIIAKAITVDMAWVSPRQARYSLPGMLKARELAPLIQIKPASGAALQFRLGLAGPRGSRGSDGLNDSRHATEEWKCD